jgi:xanthine dehydrogenase accessory factor
MTHEEPRHGAAASREAAQRRTPHACTDAAGAWLDALLRLREDGAAAVAVTVAATRGSVPREAGTKMIVTADAVHGTIGGGHLEHQAIAIARARIGDRAAGAGALRRFPLGASLGQCCGGIVSLLFEPVAGAAAWLDALATARERGADAVLVTPLAGDADGGKVVVTRDEVHGAADAELVALARRMLDDASPARLVRIGAGELFAERVPASDLPIVLFGAGHVGRALVRVLAELPCRVLWVDEREAEFPRDVPANVRVLCTDAPEEAIDEAPPGAYFLVMTHSHALDERLAEAILQRGDYAYFGLIGSQTKRRAFEKRLARRGMPAERFATMTCPIGIAGMKGKEPGVIAVAVAAQLLQVRAASLTRVRHVSDTRDAQSKNAGSEQAFARARTSDTCQRLL